MEEDTYKYILITDKKLKNTPCEKLTIIPGSDTEIALNDENIQITVGKSEKANIVYNGLNSDMTVAPASVDAIIASNGYNSKAKMNGHYTCMSSSGKKNILISKGYHERIASSGYNAYIEINGVEGRVASSGIDATIKVNKKRGIATSSGRYTHIELNDSYCIGAAVGINSKIKGKKGSWIVLTEWGDTDDEGNVPINIKATKIDGTKIKEDTFYKLKNDEFVEAY